MKRFVPHVIVIAVLLAAALGLVYGGAYNVAADDPHWSVTQSVLETARERSVATRANDIEVPKLDDPQLVAMGAEHYAEMCTGCHLAPGMSDSELRKGLYPRPPNLVEHGQHRRPEQTFWIIKHGLKMTGMPAWGMTHDDRSIWGMVAFLQKLSDLSPEEYRELVAQGSGRGHGETEHHHERGHDEQASTPTDSATAHSHEESGKPAQATKSGESASAHDHSTHSHAAEPVSPGPGAPLKSDTAEPVAVVERFFRSLAAGDTSGASALLDPNVLIFESGGAERSRAEYASHHLGADSQFLRTAKQQLLSRTGDAVGDLAWVATEARLTASGQKPADIVSTETMVLRKSLAGWRIVHIHWSSRPKAN